MGKAKFKPYHKDSNTFISPEKTSRLGEHILFSFRHVDFGNKEFQMPENKPEYFNEVVNRFQEVCKLTLNQFRVECSKSLRCHAINWRTATERGFNNIPLELKEAEDFQFSISKVKYGRIHGVLLDNIFYIVWFDPYHKLSPQN